MFWIARVPALAVLLVATTAAAQELCVTCSDPPATYRCGVPQTSGQATAGMQLLCIREVAARGGHKSCSIERNRASSCDGPLVLVEVPASGAIAPPPAIPAQDQPGAPVPPAPKPENTGQPPATVEEMAKSTAEQSKKDWDAANAKVKETTDKAGQNIQKAGSAVGGAVKKSWDCVVSLFSSC